MQCALGFADEEAALAVAVAAAAEGAAAGDVGEEGEGGDRSGWEGGEEGGGEDVSASAVLCCVSELGRSGQNQTERTFGSVVVGYQWAFCSVRLTKDFLEKQAREAQPVKSMSNSPV
jgi:hypothetical protein